MIDKALSVNPCKPINRIKHFYPPWEFKICHNEPLVSRMGFLFQTDPLPAILRDRMPPGKGTDRDVQPLFSTGAESAQGTRRGFREGVPGPGTDVAQIENAQGFERLGRGQRPFC